MTRPATDDRPDPVVTMTGFARALRASGVAADPTRLATALAALTHVDPLDARQVYWAGRVTLCAEPDDLPRYDALFDTWFRGHLAAAAGPDPAEPAAAPSSSCAPSPGGGAGEDGAEDDEDVLRTAASDTEALHHRDLALLDDAERAEVNELIALLAPRLAYRRTRRTRSRGRDAIDVRRTVRGMLADGGEIGTLARLRPRVKPRRLVLLLDVSGSMKQYADVLLRFAHAAVRVAPASTEVVHPRHPAHPRDPPAAAARPGPGAARGRHARSPTGAAAPGWARRCRPSSTAGASAARPAARRSCWPPTGGNAATPPCSASRWPGWRGWRTASCG